MAKYKAYPEYKDSGVEWLGQVPKSWVICRLKNLAVIKNGQDYKSVQADNGYPVMGSGGQFMFASKFMYDKPSVLLGRKGTIDKPLYVDVPFWTVDTMYYTELNKGVDAKYLYYLALTIQFSRYSTNTALPSMTQEHLSNYKFAIPKVESDRRKITDFLNHETAKIDNLIEKQQQLIELLKEKRQAVISHAVTKGLNPNVPMKDSGVEWLGEVPEHWIVSGFKKYLSSIVDYRGKTPNKIDDGILLVTARNIKKGELDYTLSQEFIAPSDYKEVMSRGLPDIGDVLFTTEAPLGEVANVDRVDIALAQRIIKFKGMISRLNNYYFKYFIMSSSFQQSLNLYSSGSTAQGIKAERFVYLRKLLPPINEQMQIVDFLDKEISKIDMLVEQQFVMLSLLQERRTALISAAVTGKIDVRDWVAHDTQKADKVKETAA
ncbi:restriction endonuclease subunit S [Providencia rettgeri]|nr:restriction endonuclease subunit S [Providencia rettgeri]